ncbi:Putative tartrate transporter [Ralstonia mannitolilytica]|nr:Putative tartrate transporter [Ralstonia mannitolilytica]
MQATFIDAAQAGHSAEQSACRKAAWRLVPLLAIAYFVNYLDRTNVGFAALTMNRDLGLSAAQFGLAAGIFYVGYCLFEVPSNLALYRYATSRRESASGTRSSVGARVFSRSAASMRRTPSISTGRLSQVHRSRNLFCLRQL